MRVQLEFDQHQYAALSCKLDKVVDLLTTLVAPAETDPAALAALTDKLKTSEASLRKTIEQQGQPSTHP